MASHEQVADRLMNVRIALLASPAITDVRVIQEQALGDVGYFRIRGKLANADEVLLMERFRWQNGAIAVEKYSFHWQNPEGKLIRRWDNAPHHPEISSFPHHLHDADEVNIKPHGPVDVFEILRVIGEAFLESRRTD
jgi:hypothetical protein